MNRFCIASLLPLAALAVTITGAQASPTSCSAPIYHQYDFWVGDWTVTNKQGKVVGTDSVTRQLDGCVVYERYIDAGDKSVGIGMSSAQPGNKTWHQTFMDDSGVVVTLDGTFHDGVMELRGTNYPAGGAVMSDALWIPHGSVVEEIWKVSTDAGRTWKVRFDGFFHRRGKGTA